MGVLMGGAAARAKRQAESQQQLKAVQDANQQNAAAAAAQQDAIRKAEAENAKRADNIAAQQRADALALEEQKKIRGGILGATSTLGSSGTRSTFLGG